VSETYDDYDIYIEPYRFNKPQTSKKKMSNKIHLKNVRLSFPALFKPSQMKQADGSMSDPKYGAALILDKKVNAKDIKAIEAAIAEVVKEEFNGNMKVLKGTCLRDGEEKTNDDCTYKDGYGPETMFVSASNKNRPQVVDRNPKIPLVPYDGKPYAGCYVNAVISLWPQKNTFGKRVNANLLAIQFVKDGEPFGETRVNPEEEFESLEDDSSSDEDLL
jgi:hypothetical protein